MPEKVSKLNEDVILKAGNKTKNLKQKRHTPYSNRYASLNQKDPVIDHIKKK